jgi:hypothetical protein
MRGHLVFQQGGVCKNNEKLLAQLTQPSLRDLFIGPTNPGIETPGYS